MTNRLLFLLLVQCTPRAVPPPLLPPPPGTYVEFEAHAEPTEPAGRLGVQLDQPAHVKLKLGHYRNSRFGIGVTIDLVSAATENVADIDPAKVRFDGDSNVWLLEGRYGSSGRIDYVRDHGRLILQVSGDGRYTVYIPDPETDRASQAIDVTRDGDAEPL